MWLNYAKSGHTSLSPKQFDLTSNRGTGCSFLKIFFRVALYIYEQITVLSIIDNKKCKE